MGRKTREQTIRTKTRRPARRRKVTKVPCSHGCGEMVPTASYHHVVNEAGERWTCAPDAPERKPPCLRYLGCLCAGHARGNPANAECDTTEIVAPHNDPEAGNDATCCTVCGSMEVQYAVWYRPNGGMQDFEVFGSWNAGDNTYCADCDNNGRNPNPPLVCEDVDKEEYLNARSLRLGDGRGKTFIAPRFNSEGKEIPHA